MNSKQIHARSVVDEFGNAIGDKPKTPKSRTLRLKNYKRNKRRK